MPRAGKTTALRLVLLHLGSRSTLVVRALPKGDLRDGGGEGVAAVGSFLPPPFLYVCDKAARAARLGWAAWPLPPTAPGVPVAWRTPQRRRPFARRETGPSRGRGRACLRSPSREGVRGQGSRRRGRQHADADTGGFPLAGASGPRSVLGSSWAASAERARGGFTRRAGVAAGLQRGQDGRCKSMLVRRKSSLLMVTASDTRRNALCSREEIAFRVGRGFTVGLLKSGGDRAANPSAHQAGGRY